MKIASLSIAALPHVAGALLLMLRAPLVEPEAKRAAEPVARAHVEQLPPAPIIVSRPVVQKPARTLTMRLEHGEPVPEGRPNTWIHIPATRDAAPDLRIVFLFHGFKNCIESYTTAGIICNARSNVKRPGYRVAAQLESAGSRAIVVIPETSFDIMSAEAPTLAHHGGFRAYVDELLSVLADETGGARIANVRRLALAASSGGYQALEPILDDNPTLVTDVLLLDAGYMYPNSAVGKFLAVAASELATSLDPAHHAGILYTPSGGALPTSEELLRNTFHRLDVAGAIDRGRFGHYRGDPPTGDLAAPLYLLRVDEEHDVVVRRNLGRVLATAGF